MVLFRENKLEKHRRTFENCCLMNKNPLFKKDSDIFTHIFWVTLTAAMTVITQRSYTVLPRHRDQSTPSHSREQHFTATRQRRTPQSSSPMSHLPVSGLPSSTTDHSSTSSRTPELVVPINKSDVNTQKMINSTRHTQKKSSQKR